ncbi:sigma-54 dependent transcriptional regulator [Oceanispirochaeta sp.]|uniref:sigma-54-dependent transcriptional regulator n=1 Tax=Oceanispirochaeta sp. TaxID=2035350 RepID=UPI00260573C2|nr:sigma-54 dependent transcriptional regulator [Oceanispirochaeta sp.]MDA3957670.1 sigma-54 dependent transcriptional regulator [Oceanispirochaeta sp.]
MQGGPLKILVVDDESNIRNSLKIILEQEGYRVDCAENGLSAQRFMEQSQYDAGIFDLKMPGMSGLELLEWKKESSLNFPVIMISAFGEVEDAVRALKTGAEDYVVKPFDPDVLLEKLALQDNFHSTSREFEERYDGTDQEFFLGKGPLMEKHYHRLNRIAKTRSTVLITGESGVGKEVSARMIHSMSDQSESLFLAINIGGMPENLLESELFGYEKGAFTGADKQKKGLFELASGGTLFLDEIGEMNLALQVKVLRVLQEKQFRRLGGLETQAINARIITATNRSLEDMVEKGLFREDLYYRLNVARLEIPTLRDRKEDLPRLVGFLIDKLNTKMDLRIESLSRDAWSELTAYSFPGNIRELENILERAMIFAEGSVLESEDLELPHTNNSPQTKDPRHSGLAGRTLKDLERTTILAALQRWEGNRSQAARELGISRRTIINKISEYGLNDI